jgi:hypothetical protein
MKIRERSTRFPIIENRKRCQKIFVISPRVREKDRSTFGTKDFIGNRVLSGQDFGVFVLGFSISLRQWKTVDAQPSRLKRLTQNMGHRGQSAEVFFPRFENGHGLPNGFASQ